MKLWKRTVLLMLVTLFGSLLLVGGMTLYFTGRRMIESIASENAHKTELSVNMWEQFWDQSKYDRMTDVGQEAYIKFQFDSCFGSGYQLWNNQEAKINKTGYKILDIQKLDINSDDYRIQNYSGKYLMFHVKKFAKPTDSMVIQISDITNQISEVRKLAVLYVVVYSVIFIGAGMFIFFMMRRNFNAMEELQETSRKQELLLGALAHEMKTPLTSIIGYSDSLLHVKLPEEKQKRSLEHINREGHRMEALTGKIMQLVGLYQNDAIQLQNHSVRELTERVYNLEVKNLSDHGIKMTLQVEEYSMKMDMELMVSLLVNLIDNAIRASEGGSQINLQTRILQGKKTIIVQDHGLGIPEEELSKVTGAFYMVDKSRSRKAGGAGLGLALCQKIVELHHGELRIESTLGEGTTIYILFT